MTLLFRCLSLMPLWLLHALGAAVGALAYACSGVYRARFAANVRQAGLTMQQVRGAAAHAGKTIAELPRLWLGAPVAIAWDGVELIDAAHAAGRGVLFLTPHLGCFEVTAQAYAQRYAPQGRAITVLYRPARKAWLQSVVAQSRNRPGLRAAPTTLSGVKTLMKALKSGQAVGLLPDQVPPLGLGVWAEFFGKPAYTMTLPARLAQQTGATVLLAWGERLPYGRGYVVHVRVMPGALSAEPGAAAAQVNRAMEQLVAEQPAQYLWGYARYKQPAQGMHADTPLATAAPAAPTDATTTASSAASAKERI
jgi:Kdo2-lipid IVA lauroyltransferase/acyltransferase